MLGGEGLGAERYGEVWGGLDFLPRYFPEEGPKFGGGVFGVGCGDCTLPGVATGGLESVCDVGVQVSDVGMSQVGVAKSVPS